VTEIGEQLVQNRYMKVERPGAEHTRDIDRESDAISITLPRYTKERYKTVCGRFKSFLNFLQK